VRKKQAFLARQGGIFPKGKNHRDFKPMAPIILPVTPRSNRWEK
jgi:hypothetical protein